MDVIDSGFEGVGASVYISAEIDLGNSYVGGVRVEFSIHEIMKQPYHNGEEFEIDFIDLSLGVHDNADEWAEPGEDELVNATVKVRYDNQVFYFTVSNNGNDVILRVPLEELGNS